MQWQPIETAPKDGTCILGVWVYTEDYSLVKWGRRGWEGYCDGEKSKPAQGSCFKDLHEPYLTHWMPLPEPPKETL